MLVDSHSKDAAPDDLSLPGTTDRAKHARARAQRWRATGLISVVVVLLALALPHRFLGGPSGHPDAPAVPVPLLRADNAIAVPEPSSLFLSLLAIVGVAAQRSRRRKRQTAGAASVTVL